MLENQDFLPEKKANFSAWFACRLLGKGGDIHWALREKKDPQGEEIGPSLVLNCPTHPHPEPRAQLLPFFRGQHLSVSSSPATPWYMAV